MVQQMWKIAWWFFKKLNIELPYDPEILHLGIDTQTLKTGTQIFTHLFIAALL